MHTGQLLAQKFFALNTIGTFLARMYLLEAIKVSKKLFETLSTYVYAPELVQKAGR